MKVINTHQRIIDEPIDKLTDLFKTLAGPDDKVWPNKTWPAIRFKDGVQLGSLGGHGQIRYTVIEFIEGQHVKFRFTKPDGFYGTHELYIRALSDEQSEIVHHIDMHTSFKASLLWICIIRWLHDALIEEAFDNIENHFSEGIVRTPYNYG